jgi:hypothetical protein
VLCSLVVALIEVQALQSRDALRCAGDSKFVGIMLHSAGLELNRVGFLWLARAAGGFHVAVSVCFAQARERLTAVPIRLIQANRR